MVDAVGDVHVVFPLPTPPAGGPAEAPHDGCREAPKGAQPN